MFNQLNIGHTVQDFHNLIPIHKFQVNRYVI